MKGFVEAAASSIVGPIASLRVRKRRPEAGNDEFSLDLHRAGDDRRRARRCFHLATAHRPLAVQGLGAKRTREPRFEGDAVGDIHVRYEVGSVPEIALAVARTAARNLSIWSPAAPAMNGTLSAAMIVAS